MRLANLKSDIIDEENELELFIDNSKMYFPHYVHYQDIYLNFHSKLKINIANFKLDHFKLKNEYLVSERRVRLIDEKIAKLESSEARQSLENSLHEQLNIRMGPHNPAWNRPSKL
jgi:hypothetical protein